MINENELKDAMIAEYKKKNNQLAADLKVANQTLHAADRKIEEMRCDIQLLSAILFVELDGHNVRIDGKMRELIAARIDAGCVAELSENPAGQALLIWKK